MSVPLILLRISCRLYFLQLLLIRLYTKIVFSVLFTQFFVYFLIFFDRFVLLFIANMTRHYVVIFARVHILQIFIQFFFCVSTTIFFLIFLFVFNLSFYIFAAADDICYTSNVVIASNLKIDKPRFYFSVLFDFTNCNYKIYIIMQQFFFSVVNTLIFFICF